MFEVILTACGIVLPSVLLTAAVRRWLFPVSWRVAALFLVLVFAFLGKAVFTRDMPVPLDEVMRGYPYRGVVGEVQPRNPLTNDTVKLFLPWIHVLREEIFAGRAPLWNRYSFSGYPLLANGESAPFSPFFLATLFVPLPKQLVAMAGLKLFVALLFTYLLVAVHYQAASWAASLAAVAFAFSVYQNVYLYYSATAVSVLLPFACFAFIGVARKPKAANFFWSALAVALLLAAGHPESVFHVAIATVALLLLDRVSLRGFGCAAGAAVSGLALAAPAWVPVLEQIVHSARFAEIAAERQMTPPMPLIAVKTLLSPDAFGNPALGNWRGPMNYSITASSYVGVVPLLLMLVGLFDPRSSRRERWIGLLALATFLLAMNWTVFGRLVNAVPPFSLVANDKLRFVTVFLVSLTAAQSLQRLARGRRWILGAAVAFTLAELWFYNLPFNAMARREYFVPRLPIIEKLRAIAPQEPFRILGFDWVFLPNASAQYGLEDIRGSDPMASADYARFFRLIEIPNDPIDVKRVNDIDAPGLDFLNVRFALFEPEQEPGPPWVLRYRGPDGKLYENPEALPRFFTPRRLVERTAAPLLEQLGTASDFREAVVVEGAAGENQVVSGIWIGQMSPTRFRLTIEAPQRLFVASSEPLSPGWRVKVNGVGAAVHRVNGAFIGFYVPAGKNRVVVEYRPLSFYGSMAVSAAALLLVIFCLLPSALE